MFLGGHLSRKSQLHHEGLLTRPDLGHLLSRHGDLSVEGVVCLAKSSGPLGAHPGLLLCGRAERVGEPRQGLGFPELPILGFGCVVEILRHVESLARSHRQQMQQALVTHPALLICRGGKPTQRITRRVSRLRRTISLVLRPGGCICRDPLRLDGGGILTGLAADRVLQRGELCSGPRVVRLERRDPVFGCDRRPRHAGAGGSVCRLGQGDPAGGQDEGRSTHGRDAGTPNPGGSNDEWGTRHHGTFG